MIRRRDLNGNNIWTRIVLLACNYIEVADVGSVVAKHFRVAVGARSHKRSLIATTEGLKAAEV
jgi:hypothetical protein